MPLLPTQTLAAAVCACFLLWYMLWTDNKQGPASVPTQPPAAKPDPVDEVPFHETPTNGHFMGYDGIANLGLPQIQMAKVGIAVSKSDMQPLPLMYPLDIELPASTEITIMDGLSKSDVKNPPTAITTINIPRIPRTKIDASEFIFGVATTYERLEDSLDTPAHWLGDSNAKLIGHMQPSLDADAPDRVLNKARELVVSLGLVESRYEYLDRYFALLQVLHENRSPSTKWYVFIDDDTFFLDLPRMLATFDKYDPAEPWYIGALSEDFQQMAMWGYMAYGGAGVFLSSSLLEEILPHWDKCFAKKDTGDRMLAGCIYAYTTTKFTWEHGLYQLDLYGDQSGFYEALRPQPLSLHHWESGLFGSPIDMYNLSRVASVCGNACLLEKFKFKNNWILTNRFSLIKYSDNDIRLGPIRKPDEDGKLSFRMESAITKQDGRVRQLYVRRKRAIDEKLGRGAVEAAVEVEWTPA